jgi:hypothetical protein
MGSCDEDTRHMARLLDNESSLPGNWRRLAVHDLEVRLCYAAFAHGVEAYH